LGSGLGSGLGLGLMVIPGVVVSIKICEYVHSSFNRVLDESIDGIMWHIAHSIDSRGSEQH